MRTFNRLTTTKRKIEQNRIFKFLPFSFIVQDFYSNSINNKSLVNELCILISHKCFNILSESREVKFC
jgi:hypothetical protein